MGKQRKTLRQKKQADLHPQPHISSHTSPSKFTYIQTASQNPTSPSSSLSVPNIQKDLIKTLVVTSAIAIAELVLFFVI